MVVLEDVPLLEVEAEQTWEMGKGALVVLKKTSRVGGVKEALELEVGVGEAEVEVVVLLVFVLGAMTLTVEMLS